MILWDERSWGGGIRLRLSWPALPAHGDCNYRSDGDQWGECDRASPHRLRGGGGLPGAQPRRFACVSPCRASPQVAAEVGCVSLRPVGRQAVCAPTRARGWHQSSVRVCPVGGLRVEKLTLAINGQASSSSRGGWGPRLNSRGAGSTPSAFSWARERFKRGRSVGFLPFGWFFRIIVFHNL